MIRSALRCGVKPAAQSPGKFFAVLITAYRGCLLARSTDKLSKPLERWLSGWKRLPAKELQGATLVEGSNPSLSVSKGFKRFSDRLNPFVFVNHLDLFCSAGTYMNNPLWMLLPWAVFAFAVGIKFWRITSLFRRHVLVKPQGVEAFRKTLERIWAKDQQTA